MSWKEILKQMDKHRFIYDEQKIHNYAKKLLKEEFPFTDASHFNQLETYTEGESLRLGEITFKITDMSNPSGEDFFIQFSYIRGDILFNNNIIGGWEIALEIDAPPPKNIQYHVFLHAHKNDSIDSDADIELYSAYKELENKI